MDSQSVSSGDEDLAGMVEEALRSINRQSTGRDEDFKKFWAKKQQWFRCNAEDDTAPDSSLSHLFPKPRPPPDTRCRHSHDDHNINDPDYDPYDSEVSDVESIHAPNDARDVTKVIIKKAKAEHDRFIAEHGDGNLPSEYMAAMQQYISAAKKIASARGKHSKILGIKILLTICDSSMWSSTVDDDYRTTNEGISISAALFERQPAMFAEVKDPKQRTRMRRQRMLQVALQKDWVDPETRNLHKACDGVLTELVQDCMGSLGKVYSRTLKWMRRPDYPQQQPDYFLKRIYVDTHAYRGEFLGSYLPTATILLRRALAKRGQAVRDEDGHRLDGPGFMVKREGDVKWNGPQWSSDEEMDALMENETYADRV